MDRQLLENSPADRRIIQLGIRGAGDHQNEFAGLRRVVGRNEPDRLPAADGQRPSRRVADREAVLKVMEFSEGSRPAGAGGQGEDPRYSWPPSHLRRKLPDGTGRPALMVLIARA